MSRIEPKVLILDEEPFIRDTLGLKFASLGICTQTAETYEQAQKSSAVEQPDAIIIDILHSGIKAYDFIQWLKKYEQLKNIPVFILTFKEEDPEMEFTYNVWAEEYFTKPFSPREVARKVDRVIRAQAAG